MRAVGGSEKWMLLPAFCAASLIGPLLHSVQFFRVGEIYLPGDAWFAIHYIWPAAIILLADPSGKAIYVPVLAVLANMVIFIPGWILVATEVGLFNKIKMYIIFVFVFCFGVDCLLNIIGQFGGITSLLLQLFVFAIPLIWIIYSERGAGSEKSRV